MLFEVFEKKKIRHSINITAKKAVINSTPDQKPTLNENLPSGLLIVAGIFDLPWGL